MDLLNYVYFGLGIWFICSLLSYGIAFAAFHPYKYSSFRDENYGYDMGGAILVSLAGPISLVVSIFMSDFCRQGLKFW